MTDFVSVARIGDLSPGHSRLVTIAGRFVALFNIDGAFYAIDNICLHRGGPLTDGHVSGRLVTCPWHGWQYDVTTGTLVQDPAVGVTAHETRVVGDDVQVRLRD